MRSPVTLNPLSARDPMSSPLPTVGSAPVKTPEAATAGRRFTSGGRGNARAAGFTLVEVLVAVLVISIGMLGVAKLVLAAVTSNDSAYFRTQAADLAYSVLDAMRANRAYASTTAGYQLSFLQNPNATVMCDALGSDCTPAEMAQYDLYRWRRQLASALPQGNGQIAVNPAPAPGQVATATITIEWNDSVAQWALVNDSNAQGAAKDTTPDTQTFTLESAL